MTQTSESAHEFFERYAAALLARDEKAMARMYAVPSLILFPGRSIAVSDPRQTEEFFAAAWVQYTGIDAVDKEIAIMGEAPGSVWADVTWSYDGKAHERFCYQLTAGPDGCQIAVLTPMALELSAGQPVGDQGGELGAVPDAQLGEDDRDVTLDRLAGEEHG